MALRLALVIDGDASGAKKALEEIGRSIEWVDNKAADAGKSTGEVAKATGEAAKGLGQVARDGGAAAEAFARTGKAAEGAAPGLGMFKTAAAGIVGGLVGGLIGGGVAAAFDLLGQSAQHYAQELLGIGRREADLKSHAELIRDIKAAFAEAAGAASSYGNASRAVLRFEAQQNVARLERDLAGATEFFGVARGVGPTFAGYGVKDLGPFREAVMALREDLRDGKGDVIAFRDEIGRIAENLPADSSQRAIASELLAATQEAAKLQEEVERAGDLLKGLQGDAEAASTALGGNAAKYRETGEAAESAIPALNEYRRLLAAIAAQGRPASVDDLSGEIFVDRPFAAGGFTGHLPTDAIAGVVHGGEFVFDAASTGRIGVANLEAIRRGVAGFAGGGAVGIPAVAASSGGGVVAATANDFQLLRGSLLEFLSALKQGASAGEALGGVLESLGRRLLDAGLNALGNAMFGGAQSGGGGFLQSLFSILFSASGNAFAAGRPLAFAMGGAFGGGVVGGPTLFPLGMMGEAGPEAILPLRRDASGRLGVGAAGGAGSRLSVSVTVNGARGNAEIESMVMAGVRSGLAQFDRDALPARVNGILADRRAR
jgi:hypothetical protein